jgi:hypothetical protein
MKSAEAAKSLELAECLGSARPHPVCGCAEGAGIGCNHLSQNAFLARTAIQRLSPRRPLYKGGAGAGSRAGARNRPGGLNTSAEHYSEVPA